MVAQKRAPVVPRGLLGCRRPECQGQQEVTARALSRRVDAGANGVQRAADSAVDASVDAPAPYVSGSPLGRRSVTAGAAAIFASALPGIETVFEAKKIPLRLSQ